MERVEGGLRSLGRHAAAHQFCQDFGRIHRVHYRLRLKPLQLLGPRLAQQQAGLSVFFGFTRSLRPPVAINSSDKFTPSGM